ncbi:MAG: AMP-binding protein [Candidatus Manganitrophus sp.]|nr:AMP-binding protein [Candidatus Manganitrophus sp.]
MADRDRRHHDRQLRRAGHQGPGSMGRPLPGIEAAIVRPPRRARSQSSTRPRCRASWRCGPAGRRCSAAIWNEQERYRKCFAGGWYLTGDLARRDADGYYWFVGRADDVIKSSGHLIGPFEVESVLMEHPAVAEAGVIGKPDPVAGEIVKAFVALKPGHEPAEALRRELLGPRPHPARRGGRAEGDRLPSDAAKNAQRQDHAPAAEGARAGPPEGDTSTLEGMES